MEIAVKRVLFPRNPQGLLADRTVLGPFARKGKPHFGAEGRVKVHGKGPQATQILQGELAQVRRDKALQKVVFEIEFLEGFVILGEEDLRQGTHRVAAAWIIAGAAEGTGSWSWA